MNTTRTKKASLVAQIGDRAWRVEWSFKHHDGRDYHIDRYATTADAAISALPASGRRENVICFAITLTQSGWERSGDVHHATPALRPMIFCAQR
jgi:hypothetical protein